MPIKVTTSMKYISRIDAGSTHCYYVRAGYGIKECTNKTFSDTSYGGKRKALITAKQWRDKEIKRLAPKLRAYRALRHRHFGVGVHLAKDKRFDPPKLSWRATFWSKPQDRQLTKTFSVNRYGNCKAKQLATQWRKLKLTGEL
jgi:ribonuclease HII